MEDRVKRGKPKPEELNATFVAGVLCNFADRFCLMKHGQAQFSADVCDYLTLEELQRVRELIAFLALDAEHVIERRREANSGREYWE